MEFGTVYFHHRREPQYVGPVMTSELGVTSMQIDFAEVSTWYQVEKGPNAYAWEILDEAFDACEKQRIEPILSFAHHFAPPDWVEGGPFNDTIVSTPDYGSLYGSAYEKLTILQKSFADFVTGVVERYKDRTSLYTFSHEWNLAWMFCSKKGSSEYDKLLKNQIKCTLLAYNIIKERAPNARITYGLFCNYRRDSVEGRPITPLYYTVEEFPFGPSFMIRRFAETGNRDFLDLMKTTYIFYTCYTDSVDEITPIYVDARAGDAVEALYNASVNIEGKVYRYRDYIQEVLVNPITISGNWCFNVKRLYSEEEQAKYLSDSIANILEAKKRGIPVTRILANLLDKNEDSSRYAFDRYLFVPEGLYRMKQRIDPLKRGPTTWAVMYERKQAADTFQQIVSQYK